MCSIGLESELQGGLFLRLNTSVKFKSISYSRYIEYLVRYKSKYQTL